MQIINSVNLFIGCSTTFQKQKHLKQSRAKREYNRQSGKVTSGKKGLEKGLDSLSMIGGKDSSLFLFRVLGKILYCKSKFINNNLLLLHVLYESRLELK